MCAMRALRLALAPVSLLVFSFCVAGCGDTFGKVTCSDDAGCLTAAGTLFAGDASADSLPRCCGGTCMLPAGGCDSGYRYLTSEPAYGTCAAMPGCSMRAGDMAAGPMGDMAGMPPVDMAKSNKD
jgi:hypothetical protein